MERCDSSSTSLTVLGIMRVEFYGWHPQFGNETQIVMTWLLPHLKSIYGNSVESYFLPGDVGMPSK